LDQEPRAENSENDQILAPAIVASESDVPRSSRPRILERVSSQIISRDRALYSIFSVALIAWIASTFISAMLVQTGGEWSAPLDDVFIHFDYARSTARGYPFQWSEGNGYSSGNTSVTYPFALALGYWVGARDERLMAWAVLVACLSLLVFFHASARLTERHGPYGKYFIPPIVLSLGALDWSLMSGMENAFHLGVWGIALTLTLKLADDEEARVSRALGAGFACAVLVLTRPESIVCVVSFALFLFASGFRNRLRALAVAAIVSLIPALTLVAQAAVNKRYTGEWSQAGALAKLALYHPYMTADAKWEEWRSLLKYIGARLVEHHFSDTGRYGYLLIALAIVPLFDRAVRRYALLVWPQIIGWCLIVALNGQVRWQNERYTMAAVAWLLVLVAMGVSSLTSRFGRTLEGRVFWALRAGTAALMLSLYLHHQVPNFRDQVWFFARASRNIRDQHITAGKVLARLNPPPRRIAVGDAGAITFASDRPALDLIGLGGYKDYPFARAGRHGLGATIELIEHMPPNERPDLLAIYPSWWGDLPILFGRYIGEVPVVGNVICGGASKALYRTNWAPLDKVGNPLTLREGERVIHELDVGDLMSERENRYTFPSPSTGWVVFHVLPRGGLVGADLFDAGRIIPNGKRETAIIQLPRKARLIARTANVQPAEVAVRVDGSDVGLLRVPVSKKSWEEPSLELPEGAKASASLVLEPATGEWTNYHIWIVGSD
jgi:hypothetical protein